MMIYENIRLALFSLKANKMRALLTMLGIIIGIASVIAIMTVGDSMTMFVTDTMSSMGASNIMVGLQQKAKEDSTESGLSFSMGNTVAAASEEDYFTREMLENYCATYEDSVIAISASETVGSGQIQDGDLYANTSAQGVSLGYFLAQDITLLAGRFFEKRETDNASMVAIISDRAVENLLGEGAAPEEAVGSILQVNIGDAYCQFTVAGDYEYEQSIMSFSTAS